MQTLKKPIKLSICICALGQRTTMFTRLINDLALQPRFDECEIVIVLDSGQVPTGAKRNRVLDATHGQYVACIDDDDEIANDYIPTILAAIDQNPGVDAILIRGYCEKYSTGPVFFDYRLDGLEGEWIDNTIWRSPGHLCPIRAELAKQVQFPQPSHGEDLAWSAQLKPLIKTAARAQRDDPRGDRCNVLYFYQLDQAKTSPRMQLHGRSHEEIFTPQYAERSGPGSILSYSHPYRMFVGDFLAAHKLNSIIDLGCGDGVVGANIPMGSHTPDGPPIDYLGVDVIKERIEANRVKYGCADTIVYDNGEQAVFRGGMNYAHGDLRTFLLDADLILCKDVLQHWSNAEVIDWLEHLKRSKHKFRFALITNCNYGSTVNQDIKTGSWRALDLTKPPFSIGEVVFEWGDADTPAGHKNVVLIKGRG